MQVGVSHSICVARDKPFVVLGGLNVLEDLDFPLLAREGHAGFTRKQAVPYVFKAPLDKAIRSSTKPFRDVGMEEGLRMFDEVTRLLESHPDPCRARSDGPGALPFAALGPFLAQVKAVDDLVTSFPNVKVN